MEIKKQMRKNGIMLILQIWNTHKWESYNEVEPIGKEKAKNIFKIIKFKMPKNFYYLFELNKQDYEAWRMIKPSFRGGNVKR